MTQALLAKPTSRTEHRKLKTRIRLLEAAYFLMSKNGVDETSIAEIAISADIAFGTFYNYFKSKDEIAAYVLDCVIQDLGRRNIEVSAHIMEIDPAAGQAIAIRIVLREMLTSPMWQSWLRKTDLLVERMIVGFRDFAARDTRLAIEAGDFDLDEKDIEMSFSQQIWLMVGGAKSILSGRVSGINEKNLTEGILLTKGLPPERARALVTMPLPTIAPHLIDFS